MGPRGSEVMSEVRSEVARPRSSEVRMSEVRSEARREVRPRGSEVRREVRSEVKSA